MSPNAHFQSRRVPSPAKRGGRFCYQAHTMPLSWELYSVSIPGSWNLLAESWVASQRGMA